MGPPVPGVVVYKWVLLVLFQDVFPVQGWHWHGSKGFHWVDGGQWKSLFWWDGILRLLREGI